MATTGARQSHKRGYLRELLAKADVLGIQETRGVEADLESPPESHVYWGSFDAEAEPCTTWRRGVVLALRAEVRRRAGNATVTVHQRARALGISLSTGDEGEGAIHLTVVHIDLGMQLSRRRNLLSRMARCSCQGSASSWGIGTALQRTRSASDRTGRVPGAIAAHQER